MSYDEPFFTGGPTGSGSDRGVYAGSMSVSEADRNYYASKKPYGNNPWYMPTYTNMPEGRMQLEQGGFPAISQYMCGACPRYENPQPPPMRKMSLDMRQDYAMDHYPPDHDTVKSSRVPCVSGFGGGCEPCGSGGMSTPAAVGTFRPQYEGGREHMSPGTEEVESKYEPSAKMTMSPMHIDMTSFVLVFFFIILVFICISFSRTLSELQQKIERLTAPPV